MRSLCLLALLAAGLALAVGAVAQHGHGGHEVRLVATDRSGQPFAFEPMNLTIEAGQTVRWVNDEDVFHTVTSTDSHQVKRPNGKFDGVLSSANESFAFTFTEPGTYPYYCQPHSPFMFGTITVTAAGTPPAPPAAPGAQDGARAAPGAGALGLLLAGLAALVTARRR